jgi:predicted transcriptional regulator
MRLHIVMDDELVERVDRVAGARGRSPWIVKVVSEALDHEERRAAILAGVGCIADSGHAWDDDPAEWVRQQRFADSVRVG